MKNIKGVFGLLFLLTFFRETYLFFSEVPVVNTDPEQYAIKTGATLGISLVLGVLLLRSAFKKKRVAAEATSSGESQPQKI